MKKTAMSSEMRVLRFSDGSVISYELRRKPIKNLYLRIHSDCNVKVSAPIRMSDAEIEAFLFTRKSCIFSAIAKLRQRADMSLPELTFRSGDKLMFLGEIITMHIHRSNVNKAELSGENLNVYMKDPADAEACRRIFNNWLNSESKRIFKTMLSEASAEFSSLYPHMPELSVRRMKSRWGSCHVNGNRITLNLKLIEAPSECIKFVIFHELCHFVHPDHSSSFYRLLEAFCPDWRSNKLLLEDSVIL